MTKPGYALSCFLDFVQNVTQTSKCYHFLCESPTPPFHHPLSSPNREIGLLRFPPDWPLRGEVSKRHREIRLQYSDPRQGPQGCPCSPHPRFDLIFSCLQYSGTGMALECIISKVVKSSKTEQDALTQLDNECRHEVMRLAEMQADDFNLDRPLFFACRHDREVFLLGLLYKKGSVIEIL